MIINPFRFASGGAGDDGFPIIASLWARYKASDIAIADGDPISTWVDKSGNSRDATQGTSAMRPIYRPVASDLVGNTAAVEFGGTAGSPHLFEMPSMASLSACEGFAFIRTYTTGHYKVWQMGGGSNDSYYFYGGSLKTYEDFGRVSSRMNNIDSGYDYADWNLYSVSAKPGEWILRWNNVVRATYTTGTFGLPSVPVIGGKTATSYPVANTQVAEYVFFSDVLSSGDRAAVYDYFQSEYLGI